MQFATFFFVPVALGGMLGTHRRFLCRSKMCFHSVAAVKRNSLYLILSNKHKSAPLHERSCWYKKKKGLSDSLKTRAWCDKQPFAQTVVFFKKDFPAQVDPHMAQ